MRPSFENLIGKSDLVIIEIGVDCGNNAYDVLSNLDVKKMYLIDPYSLYMKGQGCNITEEQCTECKEKAHNKLIEFADKTVWIEEKSEDVCSQFADLSIDFLYVDGNHRFEFVSKDLWWYYPKVKHGGILAGHDFDAKSVKDAVLYFAKCIADPTRELCIDIHYQKCDDPVGATDFWFYKP